MKKPEYLGDREFLAALRALCDRLNQSASLDALLPLSFDASYQSAELGAVAASCFIEVEADATPEPALYRFTVRVLVMGMDSESLVVVGSRDEVERVLQKMAEPDATHAFLMRIYRDLSELQER